VLFRSWLVARKRNARTARKTAAGRVGFLERRRIPLRRLRELGERVPADVGLRRADGLPVSARLPRIEGPRRSRAAGPRPRARRRPVRRAGPGTPRRLASPALRPLVGPRPPGAVPRLLRPALGQQRAQPGRGGGRAW